MNIFKRVVYFIRGTFPESLYKRFVLIIVLPVFLIQIFSLSFFINRNWIQNSNKHFENIIQQIGFVVKLAKEERRAFDSLNGKFLKLRFSENPKQNLIKNSKKHNINPLNLHIIKKVLRRNEIKNFYVSKMRGEVIISIRDPDLQLEFRINSGDFLFAANHVYIIFNILVSLLFLAIAWLFMKNQVAPIVRLSKAMHNFKENRLRKRLYPRGAAEIKNAINAFNAMSEEIVNYMTEQNIALAGVSHDIKTYLTRMKLQIVLIKDQLIANGLNSDVDEMEKIITEFIEYAKSDSYYYNNLSAVKIRDLIMNIAEKFPITCDIQGGENTKINCDENAIKRCFLNIISNSAKVASDIFIEISESNESAYIVIEDNGPGVHDSELNLLAKPFYKSDKSRNLKYGGVGLGLAITKNIITKHYGSINFQKGERFNGLMVKITLPK